jgi:hypothetical protein
MPGAHIIEESSPIFKFFLNPSAIDDISSKKETLFKPLLFSAPALAGCIIVFRLELRGIAQLALLPTIDSLKHKRAVGVVGPLALSPQLVPN